MELQNTKSFSDFNDLADSLEQEFAAAGTGTSYIPAPDVRTWTQSAAPVAPEFKEICKKCAGSGKWRSWGGYSGGECFACKGVGYRVFKSSSEDRAHRREQAAERVARTRQQYRDDHAQEFAFLDARQGRWDFADSLLQAFDKWGSLTENQLAAVRRAMEKSAARVQQAAVEAPVADVSKIEEAFATARMNGLKRIGVRLATFKFSPAPETGKNPGAVYVKDVNGEYLGKVLNGRLFASRECGEKRAADIIAAAADPHAAAVAYGKEFGSCSICARELSDPDSIDRGIGPICAGKYGWL